MQKWCETLEAWPSLNYARPCGADHFLRDETDYCCVTDWTDPTLTLDAGPVGTWAVNDFIGIASGVYKITAKASATEYTLTPVAFAKRSAASVKKSAQPLAKHASPVSPPALLSAAQPRPGSRVQPIKS